MSGADGERKLCGGRGILGWSLALWLTGCAVVTDDGALETDDGATGDGDGDGDGDDATGGDSGSGGTTVVLGSGGASSSGGSSSGGTSSGGSSSGGSSSGGSASGGAGSGGSGSGGSGSGGAGSGGSGSGGSGSGGAPSAGCDPIESGASGTELFSDDFESGNYGAWTTNAGTWSIVSDGTSVLHQAQTANALQLAIATDTCFGDQSIEVRVKVTDFPAQSTSYLAAIFGRVVSATTHYMLAIGSDGKLVIRKRVNSSSTSASKVGSDVDLDLVEGTWYTLRLEIVGTTLYGYVDDVLHITATDTSIAAGGVGLGTTQASAVFDDVYVSMP